MDDEDRTNDEPTTGDDFAALVERVQKLTNLGLKDAFRVAEQVEGEQVPSPVDIIDAAAELGFDMSDARKHAQQDSIEQPLPSVSMDPATVMAEVYRACPRMLAVREGEDKVYVPVIGRAPKGSEFHTPEVEEALANMSDEQRLLVGGIDVFNGTLTVTLYDEANDLDRHVGPIDLQGLETPEQFQAAIEALLSRVTRVIAADFN